MNELLHLLHYAFFKNALLGGIVVAILASQIGYFITIRNLNFTAHALSHISISGASLAILCGLPILSGQILITIIAALGIVLFSYYNVHTNDNSTALILGFILGLGSLGFFISKNYVSQANVIMFGNIFSISHSELVAIIIIAIIALSTLYFINKQLLLISINKKLAQSRGIYVGLIDSIFFTLLAITVTLTSQVVGVLLIATLLIGASAISCLITTHYLKCVMLAMLINVITIVSSILISALYDLPVNFAAASIIIALYTVAYFYQRERMAV